MKVKEMETWRKVECKRGDFACMTWHTPELVFEKIKLAGLKI